MTRVTCCLLPPGGGWMKGGGRYWLQQCTQFGPSLAILPGLTPLIIKRVTFLP